MDQPHPWYTELGKQVGIMVAALLAVIGRIFMQRDKIKQALVEDMKSDISKVRTDINRLDTKFQVFITRHEGEIANLRNQMQNHQDALEDHNRRAAASAQESSTMLRQILQQGLQRSGN